MIIAAEGTSKVGYTDLHRRGRNAAEVGLLNQASAAFQALAVHHS